MAPPLHGSNPRFIMKCPIACQEYRFITFDGRGRFGKETSKHRKESYPRSKINSELICFPLVIQVRDHNHDCVGLTLGLDIDHPAKVFLVEINPGLRNCIPNASMEPN